MSQINVNFEFPEKEIHALIDKCQDREIEIIDAEYGVHVTSRDFLKQTPIEQLMDIALFQKIREGQQEIRLRRQVRIGRYVVDFIVDDTTNKIIIECDGHQFHEKTAYQVQHDKSRDRELQKAGFKVLRFTGSEITRNPLQCALDVLRFFICEFEP